ncbi:MAG: RNA polymerase sigma factor [Acidimicrobiia bacterium]
MPPASPDDARTVEALRAGDEAAFVDLVERYQGALLRQALPYVPSRAVAEEVVQDTWIAVIRGIDGFEGRSSLRTWLYRILMNVARSRGVAEHRSIPFSSASPDVETTDPAVDPVRFWPAGEAEAGRWISLPTPWEHQPEDRLLARENVDVVAQAINGLPDAQREVITLRDVLGWTSMEVRNVLDVSETNQRVLLHRARAKVRAALERHFTEAT